MQTEETFSWSLPIFHSVPLSLAIVCCIKEEKFTQLVEFFKNVDRCMQYPPNAVHFWRIQMGAPAFWRVRATQELKGAKMRQQINPGKTNRCRLKKETFFSAHSLNGIYMCKIYKVKSSKCHRLLNQTITFEDRHTLLPTTVLSNTILNSYNSNNTKITSN